MFKIIVINLIVLAQHSCIAPNNQIITRIRNRILEKARPGSDYSKEDLDRISNSNAWIEPLVIDAKDEQDAYKELDRVLRWRKAEINKMLKDTSFPLEIYKVGYIQYLDQDNQGKVYLLIRLSKWKKTLMKFTDLMKSYLIFVFEKYIIPAPNQRVILIVDGQDLSNSNFDFDLYLFIGSAIKKYYPFVNSTTNLVNMPASFDKTEKAIRSSQSTAKGEQFRNIKLDELSKYVDKSLIPNYLKGNYNKPVNIIPSGLIPLESFTRIKFSAEEIKDIYKTFEQLLK